MPNWLLDAQRGSAEPLVPLKTCRIKEFSLSGAEQSKEGRRSLCLPAKRHTKGISQWVPRSTVQTNVVPLT